MLFENCAWTKKDKKVILKKFKKTKNSPKMKFLVINSLSIVLLLVLTVSINGAEPSNDGKKTEGTEDGIKIYKRLIPADVLRGKNDDLNIFITAHKNI